jgi:hypothetical protein
MSSTIRIRALAALFAVTTGALLFAGGPAQAGSGEACWHDTDTRITQCFADEASREDAITEQTGAVLVEAESALSARSAVGTAAVFNLLSVWDGASYTSTSLIFTTSNNTICTTGSGMDIDSMPAGWNDRVSSFKTHLSCVTRAYEDSNQGGSFFGYATNAPNLGALSNEVSSFRLV